MLKQKYLDFCERNIDRALRINADIYGWTIEQTVHRLGQASLNMSWTIEELCAYELQESNLRGRFNLFAGGTVNYIQHPKRRK